MLISRQIALASLLLSAACASLEPVPRDRSVTGEATIHVRTNAAVAYVNSIIIETSAHLIVIDPGLSQRDAEAILAYSRERQKPIAAVFVTHAHVDHYGAVGGLRQAGAPFIASEGVTRQLEAFDAINYARFGARVPAGQRLPDRIIGDGEVFSLDGVTISHHALGPGESYADSWFLASGSFGRAAIIGDVVMEGIPPFMQSGHSRDWLGSLRALQRAIPDDAAIYIGHDRRAAETAEARRDKTVLESQISHIEAFREAILNITGGERLLTDDEVEAVAGELVAGAPEFDQRYTFLITTSANTLAAELILEQQRAEFEARIREALSAR